MRKNIMISVVVFVVLTVFCVVFNKLKPQESYEYRKYQHDVYSDVDSSLGQTDIAADGTVRESAFVSHLPIVIVDTNGKEVPNIYRTDENEVRYYADENVTNPYIDATITLINNENCENRLTDQAQIVNHGQIKLRGCSSRFFEKKNYGIKLLDESGSELELPLLDMEADEDWVLSNSELDATLIRNYMAYNIGGQIFPYTSEAKFCELIIKEGNTYNYQGLYLLTESVKKSEGRVNIEDFNENENRLSYIVCRDRADATRLTLHTWASDQQLCYGHFTVKYPKAELLTDDVVARIENDLSTVEKIIYSDDPEVFKEYSNHIDVNSFIDYFVFNEFMMCYDSGNNSTYYYQDTNHNLSMGVLWDYDNCWDNYSLDTGDPEYVVYVEKPWFERLIQDPVFQKKLIKRYYELRKTILSDEYVEEFIDDTVAYLGNAAYRDRSRWREDYTSSHLLKVIEDGQGYIVDRNRDTYEEEILRLKDVQKMHSDWMDNYLEDFLTGFINETINSQEVKVKSYVAAALVFVFVMVMAVVRRKMYTD